MNVSRLLAATMVAGAGAGSEPGRPEPSAKARPERHRQEPTTKAGPNARGLLRRIRAVAH